MREQHHTVSHLRFPRRISRYSGQVIVSLGDLETVLEILRMKPVFFGVGFVVTEMQIPRAYEWFSKDAMRG